MTIIVERKGPLDTLTFNIDDQAYSIELTSEIRSKLPTDLDEPWQATVFFGGYKRDPEIIRVERKEWTTVWEKREMR